MRKISNEVFWSNVRARVGERRYEKIQDVFTTLQCMPHTPESFLADVNSKIIPIMAEAIQINGCTNEEAGRAYQTEAAEALLEVAREFPWILSSLEDIDEEENTRIKEEEIYPKYAAISERFASRGLCHSHPTEGFTCYCDEK